MPKVPVFLGEMPESEAVLMSERKPTPPPATLGPAGKSLWKSIAKEHALDAVQLVQLEEACRAKDRLDKLDELLRGDVEVWAYLTHKTRTEDYELKIDQALSQANATANLMKQLLASMRLSDPQTGKRPQQRGTSRGTYKPSGGTVSSLERARQAKSGV